jgi:KDO2-lipid IV(A) lauroyltransferase
MSGAGDDETRSRGLQARLVGGLVRALVRLLGSLPAFIAYGLADLLAVGLWLAWGLGDRRGRQRRGYWRNRRIVYRQGGISTKPPRGHRFAVARHLMWLAVDSCRMHRITKDKVRDVIDLSEFDAMHDLWREGKGIIWATAHIGVWDVAGFVCALTGIPITSVFRPSPIPGVDDVIRDLRTGSGQEVVAKQNAVRAMRRALGRGRSIGILCDSAGRHAEHYPPFLGTPAATIATPALLGLKTGAPIVVITAQRTGRFRFCMKIWDVIRPGELVDDDREQAIQTILERINDGLSQAVTAFPEQWFWQGRRFKHRPPGETPDEAGLPPVAERDAS